jgi:hypothetical protein
MAQIGVLLLHQIMLEVILVQYEAPDDAPYQIMHQLMAQVGRSFAASDQISY